MQSNIKNIFLKITLLMSVFAFGKLHSQPVNDDCSKAIDLGIVPVCDNTIFTNKEATNSDIGSNNNGTCFTSNPPENDVWFTFSTAQKYDELSIDIEGVNSQKLANIQMAVYRGVCSIDAMVERDCAEVSPGENILSFNIKNLTQGEVYFMRIGNFGGKSFEGDFTICIKERTEYNIKDDDFSSKCNGTLYDSGGKDGNYSDDEFNTFTICPQGNVKSISFDFDYYHLPVINNKFEYDTFPNPEYRYGDYLAIYNGMDTSYAEFLRISGNADDFFLDNFIYGGGIEFENCINSPCITIAFSTDDTLNAEGFVMHWHCNEGYCEYRDSSALNVKSSVSPEELLTNLVQPGISGTITNIVCDSSAYGVFHNTGTDIGISKGVILTSGLAKNAKGPNNSSNIGFPFDSPGDMDLDSLSSLEKDTVLLKSRDACIVEMDVVPYDDIISYKYVFGSEEYPEFSNQQFNDIFALLISGNDIAGLPQINNKKNMAVIPGTNKFVEINSVNPSKNWRYYHSNFLGKETQYDGLIYDSLGSKHYLLAKQMVTPCDTYHLKFAIADRFDTIFDSGVFVGELTDGRPQIFVEYSAGTDYLLDNCDLNKATVIIKLPIALEKSVSYNISLKGTANRNVDYLTAIPEMITFLPGETEKRFEINVITDDLDEGTEYIEIELSKELKCGRKNIGSLKIPVKDYLDVNIIPDNDSLFFCKKQQIELKADGVGFMHWKPAELINNPDSSEVVYTPADSAWVTVTANLIDSVFDQCFGNDSIYIKIIDVDFALEEDSTKSVCPDSEFDLNINTNLTDYKLIWSPPAKVKSETLKNSATFYADSSDFMVYVEMVGQGCYGIDSVWITVADRHFVTLTTDPDDGYYIGDTIQVLSDIAPSFTVDDIYSWEIDSDYFDESFQDVKLILNKENTLVIYNFEDENGCIASDTILINARVRQLLFPNAIFPGDEPNSIFKFYKFYNGLEVLIFDIFDRWGEKVFSCDNNDCATTGWDATYLGKPVSPGVYLYRCKVKTPTGTIQEYKGSIMVLK